MTLRAQILVRRLICVWWGHCDDLQWTADRIYLACVWCGRETPGWSFDVPRPIAKLGGKRWRFTKWRTAA